MFKTLLNIKLIRVCNYEASMDERESCTSCGYGISVYCAARSFDGLANVYGDWTRKRFQRCPGGFHNHEASALLSVLHFLPWDQVTLFWPHNAPW